MYSDPNTAQPQLVEALRAARASLQDILTNGAGPTQLANIRGVDLPLIERALGRATAGGCVAELPLIQRALREALAGIGRGAPITEDGPDRDASPTLPRHFTDGREEAIASYRGGRITRDPAPGDPLPAGDPDRSDIFYSAVDARFSLRVGIEGDRTYFSVSTPYDHLPNRLTMLRGDRARIQLADAIRSSRETLVGWVRVIPEWGVGIVIGVTADGRETSLTLDGDSAYALAGFLTP